MVELLIQRAVEAPDIPDDEDFATWVAAAVEDSDGQPDLVIRVVDEAEGQQINRQYRQQDRATNVLSFPAEIEADLRRLLVADGQAVPLGDIVICAPVVSREALEQGKSTRQHWAHLVIHGVLHLLGFDHQERTEAEAMEARETALLALLGFGDPYRSDRPAVDGT